MTLNNIENREPETGVFNITAEWLLDYVDRTDRLPPRFIMQVDAVALLKLLPDDSVDLVITDPAYESLEKHRARGTTTRLKESDGSSNAWFEIFRDARYPELLAELYRVMKPRTHAYIFCDETTADVLKPLCRDAGFWVWKSIIWVKTTKTTRGLHKRMTDLEVGQISTFKGFLRHLGTVFESLGSSSIADSLTRTGMGYHWRGSCERILMIEKRSTKQTWPRDLPTGKGRKLNNLAKKDVLYGVPVLGKDGYPTEKPQSVIEQLVLNSSNPGELVVDMFAGSGVVGAAAQKHDRHFVLGDMADASIDTICRRLSL